MNTTKVKHPWTIAQEVYEAIQRKMEFLNFFSVPYFICDEAPTSTAKQELIDFALSLGLEPDGKGTLRYYAEAPEFHNGEKWLVGIGDYVIKYTCTSNTNRQRNTSQLKSQRIW